MYKTIHFQNIVLERAVSETVNRHFYIDLRILFKNFLVLKVMY